MMPNSFKCKVKLCNIFQFGRICTVLAVSYLSSKMVFCYIPSNGYFIFSKLFSFTWVYLNSLLPFALFGRVFFSVASGLTSPFIGAYNNKKNPRHTVASIFHFYNLHNPLIISSTHPLLIFKFSNQPIFKLISTSPNSHISTSPQFSNYLIFKLTHYLTVEPQNDKNRNLVNLALSRQQHNNMHQKD